MQRQLPAALVFAAALALPQIAAAQTDFATVGKVACVPDTMTNCTAPDKCTTKDASERDKTQVLVIDFGAKTVSMRRGAETRPVGKITEDKMADGARKIEMSEGEPGKSRAAHLSLGKDGKLTIVFGTTGNKADATCKAES
jgi:hypothetical protein